MNINSDRSENDTEVKLVCFSNLVSDNIHKYIENNAAPIRRNETERRSAKKMYKNKNSLSHRKTLHQSTQTTKNSSFCELEAMCNNFNDYKDMCLIVLTKT